MNKKRFTFEYDDGQWGVPLFYDDGKKLCFDDVVDLLNEQQATIEQLKAQLREKEEDEKLYANEILELRETNKEWLQFKSLGGDY